MRLVSCTVSSPQVVWQMEFVRLETLGYHSRIYFYCTGEPFLDIIGAIITSTVVLFRFYAVVWCFGGEWSDPSWDHAFFGTIHISYSYRDFTWSIWHSRVLIKYPEELLRPRVLLFSPQPNNYEVRKWLNCYLVFVVCESLWSRWVSKSI